MADVRSEPKADALYISLRPGKVEESDEVARQVIVDYDAGGQPVGVEFIGALLGDALSRVLQLFSEPKLSFEDLSKVPDKPGIYAIYDKAQPVETPVYIGKSKTLRQRLKEHLYGVRSSKGAGLRKVPESKEDRVWLGIKERGLLPTEDVTPFIQRNTAFQYLEVGEEGERERLEHLAIALFWPVWNRPKNGKADRG